jgi:hypothetical protein
VNTWERANVQAAASYLRERMSQGAADPRTKAVYEGLLEVLDPTRRATRVQRELATATRAAATVQANRERRERDERRRLADRRRESLGSPTGVERRRAERRRLADRRRRA